MSGGGRAGELKEELRAQLRIVLQGGVHESKTDAPKHIPGQFWEAGIYENE